MRRDALFLPLAISLALSAVASPSGGPADGLSALEAGGGPPSPGILVQLTRDPAQEVEPKWSPDATSLSFPVRLGPRRALERLEDRRRGRSTARSSPPIWRRCIRRGGAGRTTAGVRDEPFGELGHLGHGPLDRQGNPAGGARGLRSLTALVAGWNRARVPLLPLGQLRHLGHPGFGRRRDQTDVGTGQRHAPRLVAGRDADPRSARTGPATPTCGCCISRATTGNVQRRPSADQETRRRGLVEGTDEPVVAPLDHGQPEPCQLLQDGVVELRDRGDLESGRADGPFEEKPRRDGGGEGDGPRHRRVAPRLAGRHEAARDLLDVAVREEAVSLCSSTTMSRSPGR